MHMLLWANLAKTSGPPHASRLTPRRYTIMTIRLATAARKGGVGKTTLAIGIASAFAHQGKRVLVCDLDPQANAAYGLGVDPTAPGVADWLLGKSPEPLRASERIDVLPGGPALSGHEIGSLHPYDLADAVAPLAYDVFIFDLPPFSGGCPSAC